MADLFKFRHRLGLDLALEALREGIRSRLFTPNALLNAAKINRVATTITPYLESMFE